MNATLLLRLRCCFDYVDAFIICMLPVIRLSVRFLLSVPFLYAITDAANVKVRFQSGTFAVSLTYLLYE